MHSTLLSVYAGFHLLLLWQLYHFVECHFASPKCILCLLVQLLVAPLQKLTPKANATIKDIGSIDSLVQSFGPYITGMFCPIAAITFLDAICVCTSTRRCNVHRNVLRSSCCAQCVSACLQAQTLKMKMLLQRTYWMLMVAHTTNMSPMRPMGPMAAIKLLEPPLRSAALLLCSMMHANLPTSLSMSMSCDMSQGPHHVTT